MFKILKQKAEEFLTSRKHNSNLPDIIDSWDEHAKACISMVERIFLQVLERKDMIIKKSVSLETNDHAPSEEEYVEWLKKCYEKVWEKLLFSMANSRQPIQALSAAINIMAAEGKFPIEERKENIPYYFPVDRLKLILGEILSSKVENRHLIAKFFEFIENKDLLHFTWISLPAITHKGQPSDTYIKNYLDFVQKLPVPKKEGEKSVQEILEDLKTSENEENKEQRQELLCGPQNEIKAFYFNDTIKKSINRIWARIHQWKLTASLHKQLLLLLLEKIMPHLDKPILLTDYLMYSLGAGGSISLLALQGIFVLVTKHNIEYPDIYGKLYSLFEPNIFFTKHKTRLFDLTDTFLRSTHVPEATLAAFAKRFSRLALIAPPEDILVLFLLVGNILKRFPVLKKLVNRSEENIGIGEDIKKDPYNMEEKNPAKSNALASSLWEIKSLQSHVLPDVALAASFIAKPLSAVDNDLSTALKRTGDDIFEKRVSSKFTKVALTFERPNSMKLPKDEKLQQFWEMV